MIFSIKKSSTINKLIFFKILRNPSIIKKGCGSGSQYIIDQITIFSNSITRDQNMKIIFEPSLTEQKEKIDEQRSIKLNGLIFNK